MNTKPFILLMLALLLVLPLSAQDVGGWTLESIQTVGELVGDEYLPRNPILAPDGSAIAWAGDLDTGVCLYVFASAETTCTPWDDMIRAESDMYNVPVWSPDSSTIVFHESTFLRLHESDLWFFDVASGAFTNVTEDGAYGDFMRLDASDGAALDFAPAWNPGDGMLYFLRAAVPGYATSLYRLTADGDAELVRDVTTELPLPLSLVRPPAFSADGARLALVALSSREPEAPTNGVWVFDLETDALEQVATVDDLQVGRADWMTIRLLPDDVQWYGNLLLVTMRDTESDFTPLVETIVSVNPDTGEVAPLTDFSDVPDEAAFTSTDSSGHARAHDIPLAGAPSPDGTMFWVLLRGGEDQRAVGAVALGEAAGAPVVLGTIPYLPHSGVDMPPTVSSDGKVLLHDILLTFVQE